MAEQVHRAAWKSRGFMSFTILDGAVLYLGKGTLQTAPTVHISAGVSGATGFLATGIPQDGLKTRFAQVQTGDTNGHTIKHAVITFVSAGATSPSGRKTTDGSVATTALGAQTLTGDSHVIENSPEQIYNFTWFNRSGGNAVVEVEPFE
jgi:hypothetical protein